MKESVNGWKTNNNNEEEEKKNERRLILTFNNITIYQLNDLVFWKDSSVFYLTFQIYISI